MVRLQKGLMYVSKRGVIAIRKTFCETSSCSYKQLQRETVNPFPTHFIFAVLFHVFCPHIRSAVLKGLRY